MESFGAALQVPELAGTRPRVESSTRQGAHCSSRAVPAPCRVRGWLSLLSAGWMRRDAARCWSGRAAGSAWEGWGFSPSHLAAQGCGHALTSAAGKEHGSLLLLAASAVRCFIPGWDRNGSAWERAPQRALWDVDARSMQTSFVSGAWKKFHTQLQLKSPLLFAIARQSCQGTGQRTVTGAKKI